MTTNRKCPKCKGIDGKLKSIYNTESDAMDTIAYLKDKNPDLILKYYKCPHGNGYHLSEKL